MVEIIDGFGQIGTRVYAHLSDAPAPRNGAFIFVDDGTTGILYVGVNVFGTLTWVQVALTGDPIVGLRFRNDPTDATLFQFSVNGGLTWSGMADWQGPFVKSVVDATHENFITATSFPGIQINVDSTAVALDLIQTETSTSGIIQFNQNTGVTAPFLTIYNDDGFINLINQYRALQVVALSAAPSPSSALRGMVIIEQGTGVKDAPKIELRQADGSYAFDSLIGAVGPVGPAGADGTNGTNGTDGAQGQVNFPPLPTSGSATFQMIVEAQGSFLPWVLPQYYTYEVVSMRGIWQNQVSDTKFTTDGNGAAGTSLLGFLVGQIVSYEQTLGTSGVLVSQDGPFDPQLLRTITDNDKAVILIANTDVIQFGYIVAEVEVTFGGPTYDWSLTYDFTLADPPFTIHSVNGTYDPTYGYVHFDTSGSVVGVSSGIHATGTTCHLQAIEVELILDTASGSGAVDLTTSFYHIPGFPHTDVPLSASPQLYTLSGLDIVLFDGIGDTTVSMGVYVTTPDTFTQIALTRWTMHGSGPAPSWV